jgi:hypothetical protein
MGKTVAIPGEPKRPYTGTTNGRLRGASHGHLHWGRTVHALRAMTEIATWEHQDRIDVHRGHPWVAMRTVLEDQLATVTD